jgi:crossover junction endodeoxyribonuclease RuvC
MLVLGIDPGSRITGWGLVRRERGRYVRVASGAIRPPREYPLARRLLVIHDELRGIVELHHPQVMAVEAIFRHKSSESALRLGHARGVILLVGARAELPIFEYHASHIKNALTGYGRADKVQVAKVVGMFLGETLEGPRDVTDALAVAITHLAHARAGAPPPPRTPVKKPENEP